MMYRRSSCVFVLVIVMATICGLWVFGEYSLGNMSRVIVPDPGPDRPSTQSRDSTHSRSEPISHTEQVNTGEKDTSDPSFYLTNSVLLKSPPLQYVPPPGAKVRQTGIPFNVTRGQLDALGIPFSRLSVLNQDTIKDFVFVAGASANHFVESLDAIGGVQKHMPGYRIYFYDLGLLPTQVKQVKTFCDVTYRRFDFDRYPDHVTQLKIYAFKPLIIQEVLRQHRGVVWMDSSFRLFGSLSIVYPQIMETGGYLQFWHSPHSNFAVTDPGMYQYIPTDPDKQKEVWSRAAGAVYFLKTDKIYFGIFYWWVLCALDKDCISPPRSKLSCHFEDKVFDSVYAGCHRYDMSALAANLYGYNDKRYTSRNVSVVKIIKKRTKYYNVQNCEE